LRDRKKAGLFYFFNINPFVSMTGPASPAGVSAPAPLFFAQTTEAAPAPAAAPGAQQPPPGAWVSLLFPILLIVAFYFLLIAPQRKRQKEHAKLIESLGPGDEVLTQGGIYGTITAVHKDRFVVKIADSTRVEVGKSYVAAAEKKA
jgi:preprotein translocase subunit YajC